MNSSGTQDNRWWWRGMTFMCEARIQNAKKKCKLQGKMEAHDVQNGFKKFLFGASSKPSFQGIKCNGSNEWNAGEKGIVKGEKTLQGKNAKTNATVQQTKYGPECEKDINNCQGIENFFLLENSLKNKMAQNAKRITIMHLHI